jgi:hypothetical protein
LTQLGLPPLELLPIGRGIPFQFEELLGCRLEKGDLHIPQADAGVATDVYHQAERA